MKDCVELPEAMRLRESTAVPVKLVVIDDDPQVFGLIQAALAFLPLEVLTTTDPEEGLQIVLTAHPEIVLLDMMMPKLSGMELLERIVECDPGTDVILMTGAFTTESAVEAIRKGACDYLEKPLALEKLRGVVGDLVDEVLRRRKSLALDHELLNAYRYEGMVGRSPLMLELFNQIRRIGPYFRTVLISGDTGTGKELVAAALHRLSPVAKAPFVVCNSSAVVETLFESELFGYVKGAFTGATQDKAGVFEYANGGTVFLDEIGELPLGIQAKLLRVLQNQEIQRVGSPVVRKVDVRVVAASNRDLRQMITAKQFREDLYYRLAMVEVKLPRLAERKEDLPLLERHFLERFSEQYHKPIRGLTRRAQALLARYSWPGNVRELENALGHACMMADTDLIDIRDLPENLRLGKLDGEGSAPELVSLEEMSRGHARRVVSAAGGNKVQAARILGISRATLYRLLDV